MYSVLTDAYFTIMYLHGGLFVISAFLLIILEKQTKYAATNSALIAIDINRISIISFSVLIVLAFLYLLFPNYLSHADATVAYLGLSSSRNLSLWPILKEDYS